MFIPLIVTWPGESNPTGQSRKMSILHCRYKDSLCVGGSWLDSQFSTSHLPSLIEDR